LTLTYVTAERQQPAPGDAARQRLKEAGVAAFSERGFHGTTTRDIAATAGMSPAALYVHHASKEELLFALCLEGHRRTLALVEAAEATAQEPVGQLRAIVHAFVRYHAEEHTSARVVNYELGALSPEHRAEVLAVRRGIEAAFRRPLERGVVAGVLVTASPAMAAVMLSSIGVDVARWYSDGGAWSPDELADFYTDHAIRMFLP
ncbi:MAG: kstR2 1, partial [Nocardioidaceae bacterium]|nr:kstR2 1 [Nocardioidaceae bacterium]